MNQVLFHYLSFSVLISLSSADESLFYEYSELDCVPAKCGNVRNITFPFWVENQQQSYCGFPSFKLTCRNRTPTLAVSSLQVKNIFYENRSVLVVDEFRSTYTYNLPLDFDPTIFNFNISGANKELVFLYDCTKPPSDDYYKINCTSGINTTYPVFCTKPPSDDYYKINRTSGINTTYAVWAVWDSTDLRYYNTCRYANILVAGYMADNIRDCLRAVNYGFLLSWPSTDCELCKNSNGKCGYNESYYGFMCICPDGTTQHATCYPIPEKKRSWGAVIEVVAGVGGVFLFGMCVVLFLCVRRKRNLLSSKMDPETEETYYNTHIFSYDELEEATHGFHESRKLGNGGFGTVYKGELRDGRTVAVKRLYENKCRLEQFMNEVEILSCVRHQNLVTLYGCTSRHSRELLLVYEYIPNGTLADHLHGSLTSKPALPWSTRMSIIIQIAEALTYLHSVEPQIIHRDVKTNNILVDNNFQVKVADFGISRLFPLDATHVSTAPQGTFGYLDPAYYRCFQLTDKSDVYSFGVVLIELISSKPAVDITRHSDEISLANMAIAKIQKCRVGELVDSDLGYGSDLEITEMIDQVARLAFRCLLSDAEMRPGLKEVLRVLKHIKGEVDADGVGSSVKEECKLLSNAVLFSSDYATGR